MLYKGWSPYCQARKVPRKVELSGNQAVATNYLRQADQQLAKMEEGMMLAKPWPLKAASKTVVIEEKGIVIETWSCFSLQGVRIHSFAPQAPVLPVDNCWCSCHMSEGIVDFNDDTQDHIYTRFTNNPVKYNVTLCKSSTYLSVVENVMASDFQKYEKGDKVVVVWISGEHDNFKYLGVEKGCEISFSCRILPINAALGGYTLL